MHRMVQAIVAACLMFLATGCIEQPVSVRPLPVPEAEQPTANLPIPLHQRNWTGSLGQGSCVHASLVNHLRWLNEYELGERWRSTYSDGEWDSRLRDRLDAAGIDYSYTLKADPRFLDWASTTRRGAILWWKTGPLLHVRRLGGAGWKAVRGGARQQLSGPFRTHPA